jgi:hypothetical protein
VSRHDLGGRLDELVHASEQLWPICDACCHVAAENPIEGKGVEPLGLDVVDLELDIGRDPIESVNIARCLSWDLRRLTMAAERGSNHFRAPSR